jgi:hypothetical protein
MADTTRIEKEIEPFVRVWLGEELGDTTLTERAVTLLSGGVYMFDAVSEDRSIVAAILCNRPKTRTGRENTGGVRKALGDFDRLKQLQGNVSKIMVFTDPEFCSLIQRRAKRFGTQDIDFKVCQLPPEKQKLLDKILNEASREQRAAE